MSVHDIADDAGTAGDADGGPRNIIHQLGAPVAFRLLERLCANRAGWERVDHGAFVDWTQLVPGTFSTSETAVVHMARGLAMLEAHCGGAPAHLRPLILEAVEAVT